MPICEPESIEEDLSFSRQEPRLTIAAPPSVSPVRPERRRSTWKSATLIAIACAVAALAAIILFHAGAAAAPVRLEPMILGFQAAPREDHLLLTWNPAAKAVRDATSATLSIHDGPETEDVPLDLDTLHRGGVNYFPVFENASFRLSLTAPPTGSVSEQAHATLLP
jgi:anti-sigma-K factor RskA